jgi:hypothetical protein
VSENTVLRIFGPKRKGNRGVEKTIMMSLMICTPYQMLFGLSKQDEMGRACSMYGGE